MQERRPAQRTPEERAVIDRAKARLMEAHGASESDAYHAMRRCAMRAGRKLVDVAREIAGEAQPA